MPSFHEGCKFLIEEGEILSRQNASDVSPYHYSYFAWYSDLVVHSLPFAKGHRLALRYDLTHQKVARRTCRLRGRVRYTNPRVTSSVGQLE